MRRALFAISILVGFLAVPASAADTPITATPAMWVVHGPKGMAYLLGSIHVLPKNVDWQTPEITAAMKKADTFVFEVPMDKDTREAAVARFQRDEVLPESEALPSYFDEAMRADYREVIFLTHADPTSIVYMRPWLAALVLQGAADGNTGFIAAEGVDTKVYAAAMARGINHYRAFETYEQQFRLLMGDGDLSHEVELLRLTFKEILKSHRPEIPQLFAAWCKGDTKALASFGPGSTAMSPEAKKALLEDRNRAWIPKIVAMLDENHTYFITVGAGHLVGQTGVPNLLRAQGYTVDGP